MLARVTTRRLLVAALGITLLAEAVLFLVLLRNTELGAHPRHAQLLAATSAPVWLLAVFLLSRVPLSPRRAALLVLGVSAAFQVIALSHGPSTSDDDYRYVWDGKVQLSGTDPYRYPPSSDALADLREPFLFGPPEHCVHKFVGGCTSINRPTVRTIYPPVAEGAFAAIRLASFGGNGGHLPLQLAGLLGSLAVGWLLLRRGRPWLAAVWAWCPVVVVEYANNAHIDWLAVLFVALAFVLAKRTWSVGALVGAAIAVKLYPALVLPALMRRNWLVAVAAGLVVAVTYVPHVLAVGADVIGYLPGYLEEEKYGSGERLLLLGPLLGHPLDTIVGALILAAVGLWAWLRGSRDRPERSAVVVVGVTFCVFTPSYGWYAGVLLVLVALTGALEWLPVVLAPTFAYVIHSDHDTAIYVVAVGLAAVIRAVRPRVSRPTLPAMISAG